MKEFVVASLGRVFQGVEYPSRRDACQARHREYVRALADGLNFTQAAHAVGVSKRTGKVWRNGRTRSSGWCEQASIAPQELFNDPCPSLVIPSIVTISVLVRPVFD